MSGERGARRVTVTKTYKLFLGGGFPRSESGRSLSVVDRRGRVVAQVCRASRKDLREAVEAAARALPDWSRRDAYNRGQILYRMAEMLEARAGEMAELLALTVPGGLRRARRETAAAVDRLVHFAGWADKFPQVLGNANPVPGPYYNFTIPEPSGVTGVVAPAEEPLLALVSLLAPPLCAGCTIVALASPEHPLAASVLGEVCAVSDLPAGAVNLLSGRREELLPHLAGHREVIAIHAAGCSRAERRQLEEGTAGNLKRVRVVDLEAEAWYDEDECHSPWWIEPFVEMKTIWHPSAY
ncbi:MAG: aldehyde dehydrogenase family protein [Planctomycetota bacterium]|nr:MAG: aldehyde dehydrogenase family protein [Planctomycetota bacterium]